MGDNLTYYRSNRGNGHGAGGRWPMGKPNAGRKPRMKNRPLTIDDMAEIERLLHLRTSYDEGVIFYYKGNSRRIVQAHAWFVGANGSYLSHGEIRAQLDAALDGSPYAVYGLEQIYQCGYPTYYYNIMVVVKAPGSAPEADLSSPPFAAGETLGSVSPAMAFEEAAR